jgi:hypothetical protein
MAVRCRRRLRRRLAGGIARITGRELDIDRGQFDRLAGTAERRLAAELLERFPDQSSAKGSVAEITRNGGAAPAVSLDQRHDASRVRPSTKEQRG